MHSSGQLKKYCVNVELFKTCKIFWITLHVIVECFVNMPTSNTSASHMSDTEGVGSWTSTFNLSTTTTIQQGSETLSPYSHILENLDVQWKKRNADRPRECHREGNVGGSVSEEPNEFGPPGSTAQLLGGEDTTLRVTSSLLEHFCDVEVMWNEFEAFDTLIPNNIIWWLDAIIHLFTWVYSQQERSQIHKTGNLLGYFQILDAPPMRTLTQLYGNFYLYFLLIS